MAFEDDEITEDDLREAGFVEDDDEDYEDGEESGDDFAIPRPIFDAMGNPVSPPPINPDGSPISSFQQRKLEAKTNRTQATPSNTPVVQQATPVVAPVEPQKQQTQHMLEKLKSVEATFDVSLSLTLPDMSMLKMLKENSDMSDDDFISFISTKINPKEIAEKIWNLNK